MTTLYQKVLEDARCFEQFKQGDERAFGVLYQAFKIPLYAFALRMVVVAEEAEDIVVEAFTKAWEHRDRMKEMAHVKNFLYKVTQRLGINYLERKERRQVGLDDAVTGQIDAYYSSRFEHDRLFAELVQDVIHVVGQMTPLRQKVFQLRHIEGYTVEETAYALGMTTQSVYWHTKEGVQQVKRVAAPKRKLKIALEVLALALLIQAAEGAAKVNNNEQAICYELPASPQSASL